MNILLALRGYKLIDEISALWKVQYKNMSGKDVTLVEYSIYKIFYNERRDLYKMTIHGFKPIKHYLHGELSLIIDFLNSKPENEFFDFYESIQDYFIQKENLMNLINTKYGEIKTTNTDSNLIILRFELNSDREFIMSLRNDDPTMGSNLKSFKNSDLLPKDIEIYEEFNNVLITSEGYYVCTNAEFLNKLGGNERKENGEAE